MRLARILANHVDAAGLGEVFIAPLDILLGEHDIVQPDIVFVATANQAIVTEKHIRGVPDLLVAITSPFRPELDTRDKRFVYARCGVPCYWIVDPSERRVSELKLAGGRYVAAGEPPGDTIFRPALFPGLAVDLSRLWVRWSFHKGCRCVASIREKHSKVRIARLTKLKDADRGFDTKFWRRVGAEGASPPRGGW